MSAPISSSPQIGFIGLGAMGFGMATQLLSCGFTVKGYDVYKPQVEKFTTQGGVAASSPKEAADGSKVLIIMVANAAQCHEALFSASIGALTGLVPGSIIILCSTVSPGDVLEFRQQIPEQICFIDAPVSGGTARAANGTLTILASGPKDEIALARPFLEAMAGKDTLHIIPGEIGNGMKTKTVHQTLAGIHITMTAEALGFAAALGLDIREMVEYISSEFETNLGQSWMFQNRTSHLLSGDKSVKSALNIIVKDMGIVTAVGRDQKVPVFLSSAAAQVLNKGVGDGYGLEDDAYLYRVYLPKEQAAIPLQVKPATSLEATSVGETKSHLHLIMKMLSNVHLAATAEALNFGAKLGLEGWVLYDIVKGAAGTSAMFVNTGPEMLRRDFTYKHDKTVTSQREPSTKSSNILGAIEDLSAVVEQASMIKFPLHLTATALQMLQSVAARGMEEESNAAIIKFFD